MGHTTNLVFSFVSHWLLQISAAVVSVLLFFLIYWILPNRKLPVRAVLPTAIVIGLFWELAKMLYVAVLPWMNLHSVYGPFSVSVSLMLWAFITGLLLLAGAHYSASRSCLAPGLPGRFRTGKGRGSAREGERQLVRSSIPAAEGLCSLRKALCTKGLHRLRKKSRSGRPGIYPRHKRNEIILGFIVCVRTRMILSPERGGLNLFARRSPKDGVLG